MSVILDELPYYYCYYGKVNMTALYYELTPDAHSFLVWTERVVVVEQWELVVAFIVIKEVNVSGMVVIAAVQHFFPCCVFSQEFTRVSPVSSQRAKCVAATSHSAASFIMRRASASTRSPCSTTRASAAHCTHAWAATTAAAPSKSPPRVRNRNTTHYFSLLRFLYI